MLKIALCDDDAFQLTRLSVFIDEYVAEHPYNELTVKKFTSPSSLIASLKDDYDIFMLDIIMPNISGIELAREIRRKTEGAVIIFLTSSRDFAIEAYDVNALQYLVKPVRQKPLFAVLDDAVSLIGSRHLVRLPFKTKEMLMAIPLQSILYAEFKDHIVHLHLQDGSVLQSTYIRTAFDEAIAPLITDSRFVKTHKSFIVNMEHVHSFAVSELTLVNDEAIPISRGTSASVKIAFMEFLLHKEG